MAHFPCTSGCQAQKAGSPNLQVVAAEQPPAAGHRDPQLLLQGVISRPVPLGEGRWHLRLLPTGPTEMEVAFP